MTKVNYDPATELNTHTPAIVQRFGFERPEITVGRSTLEDKADPEIYSGTIVTSYGYYRMVRHIPTGAIAAVHSKSPSNLRGTKDEDGRIIADHEGLSKSYLVPKTGFKTNGKDEDTYIHARKIRREIRKYGRDLAERSETEHTLYGAEINNPEDAKHRLFNTDTPTEIWSNGRVAYLIDKTRYGQWQVTFYAPTKEEDGKFVPVTMGTTKLKDLFGKASRTIRVTKEYDDAREAMAQHWQSISSKLWDEENIYKGEGFKMRTTKALSSLFNTVTENKYALAALVPFGAALAAFKPTLGILGALAYVTQHFVFHEMFSEGLKTSAETYKRVKRAKNRLSLDSYPQHGNVNDHFLVQTSANIKKKSPKIDLERFPAEEWEFLNAKQSSMVRDHEFAVDGFHPDSMKDQIMSMHQRGFSSTCVLPDDYTRVDMFQNGLVRLMHQKPDGQIRIYAGYRADLCTNKERPLPKEIIAKLKDGIVEFDYDRRRPDFNHAFLQRAVNVDEMMDGFLTEHLFKADKELPDEAKERTMERIKNIFSRCAGVTAPAEYITKHTPAPDIINIMHETPHMTERRNQRALKV